MGKIVMFAVSVLGVVLVFAMTGCAEEGEAGSLGVDCGEHGSEHDGHCHCDPGYLFDGATCVSPTEIDQICEEEDEAHDDDPHHASACECPSEEACPCDHGEVEEHAGKSYCVPALHEDK